MENHVGILPALAIAIALIVSVMSPFMIRKAARTPANGEKEKLEKLKKEIEKHALQIINFKIK